MSIAVLATLLTAAALRILVYSALAQSEGGPTAPSNLTAEIVDGGVSLTWHAPAENAEDVDGYEILRRRPN